MSVLRTYHSQENKHSKTKHNESMVNFLQKKIQPCTLTLQGGENFIILVLF